MTFFSFMVRAAAISLPMNPPPMTAKRSHFSLNARKAPVIGEGAKIDNLIVSERKTTRSYRRWRGEVFHR